MWWKDRKNINNVDIAATVKSSYLLIVYCKRYPEGNIKFIVINVTLKIST